MNINDQFQLFAPCVSERRIRGVECRCSAVFSHCQKYRFELWRKWDDTKPYVNFVLLNPSTATAETDDNTMIRCVTYAMDWGFGAMVTTNIFAFRATEPEVMKAHESPIGIGNDGVLERIARGAGLVVAGWGTHGAHLSRGHRVMSDLLIAGVKLHCLKITSGGFPSHPLYLKRTAIPFAFP